MTENITTKLIERLQSLGEIFQLPQIMLTHGLIRLRQSVDISASTAERIHFFTKTAHLLDGPYNCTNMVYMLLKHPASMLSVKEGTVSIGVSTLLYGGQATIFGVRETLRSGEMKDSHIKICIQHGLSQYQKDCLESCLIKFLLLTYKAQCINRSIYPQFVYQNIPCGMSDSNIQAHQALDKYSTSKLQRRVIEVKRELSYKLFPSEERQALADNDLSMAWLIDWLLSSTNRKEISRLFFANGEQCSDIAELLESNNAAKQNQIRLLSTDWTKGSSSAVSTPCMNSSAFWALDPLFKTHVKVFTRDIHALTHIPEFTVYGFPDQFPDLFWYGGHLISNVEIMGHIVGVEQTHSVIIYTVDDGMGTIACCLWTTGGYNSPEFELGNVVRVLGKLNEYRDTRQLNIHDIYSVDDPNLEILNWLQISRLREDVYSKPFPIPDDIKLHGPELEALLKEQSDGLIPSAEDETAERIEVTDEKTLKEALLRYLQENNQDGRVEYDTVRKSKSVQTMARDFLINTAAADQNHHKNITITIRQAFDALVKDGALYIVDNEMDIYQVVQLDANLAQTIINVFRELNIDSTNIHHGGVTQAYIGVKVKEDPRYEKMTKAKIFEALQMLVMNSVIYQVGPQEYKIVE